MGWIILFAAVALVAGFFMAFMSLVFLSVGTGFSETNPAWFVLLGSLYSFGLFAWQMSIRERFRRMSNRPGHVGAFRAKLEAEKKRAEDPFYEPSPFPWGEGRQKPVIDPSWDLSPDPGDNSPAD